MRCAADYESRFARRIGQTEAESRRFSLRAPRDAARTVPVMKNLTLSLLVIGACAPALAPAQSSQADRARVSAASDARVPLAPDARVPSATDARVAPVTDARIGATPDSGEEQLRLFVERAAGPGARVEVSVGRPGVAFSLAPCERMEPFVPAGARLWGRTTLGVRCVQGASWQALLPVEVRIFGLAPVAARPLAAGDTVSAADLLLEEVELTRYPAGAIADPNQLGSKALIRPVPPGQTLLASWFRARPVIAQGDTVKVVYSGKGFSVSAEGRALQQGLEGGRVRVQLESGRNITGIARDGRVVELTF